MSIPSRSQLETLLERVKRGESPLELVHTPHESWPYPRVTPRGLRFSISILDSSFNPPTRAHLALASLPPHTESTNTPNRDLDARLLLLSVRNADKGLKPMDATYVQRLEMMIRLARDIHPAVPQGEHNANVAVAIIDEPTFVGKARILTDFLQRRIISLSPSSDSLPAFTPSPELTFLVGMDTLERILATRYYPSPSEMRDYLKAFMTTSRLVCARRVIPGQLDAQSEAKEKEVLALAREYLDVERLTIVELEEDIESYSSSEIRRRIEAGDEEIWRNMVTPSIAEYITVEGLYRLTDVAQ